MSGNNTGVTGGADTPYVPYHEPGTITMLAGPCSIEDAAQMEEVAACLERNGLTWIRGGAFKPRTSPYSFQGLGKEGLKLICDASKAHGLKSLCEVLDTKHIDMAMDYVDALQIGTRNMANFELLKDIGQATAKNHMPVLFKRGMAATIDEWLSAVEYITQYGNPNIMLCERGMRTFEIATRFTLDISAVPVIHKRSLLPICVDVSHPAGQADLVPALAKAAVASGADAVMIEIHPNPAKAKSDAAQQLTLSAFEALLEELRKIAAAVGKVIV
ncbi:MAG: 3-deoxy-7-phosphoheptulonate synthase [Coriobacteriales bacterium]|jgi:3-deoxy-7-phosphoheptulonate synthase|nr:3-deoxy-7-phosphoheptulonate synthase [Coriobacteriales bacterium]